MREVRAPESKDSFLACLATILELPFDQMPALAPGEDPSTGWTVSRWLGGLGLGLARIADPVTFTWAGPWIGRVGHEFTIGEVRCRGMRLCEPCMVVQRYAGRPVLRALVHRGGLRADILRDGEIKVGDEIRAL